MTAEKSLTEKQESNLVGHVRWDIIAKFKEYFEPRSEIHALWLEGADALGRVDIYSDIDFWFDVDDGSETAVLEHCLELLRTFGPLDFVERYDHPHPKIFQYNAHIEGTSEFLLLDICVQSHSRGSEGCTFVEGDVAELPSILFDKSDVVKLVEDQPVDRQELQEVFTQCCATFEQQSRLRKYLLRKKYLEATAYYGKYVFAPLVTLYRLLHTPRHHEYGLVHISDHLPPNIVRDLEILHSMSSLSDIEERLVMANTLYDQVCQGLRQKYSELE